MNATPMTDGTPPALFAITTVGVTVIIAPPGVSDANGKFVERGRRISILAKGVIRLLAVAACLVGRFQVMDMDEPPTPTGRAEG